MKAISKQYKCTMYVYITNPVFKITLTMNINKHVFEWSISFLCNPTVPEEAVHVPQYSIFTSVNTPSPQSVFRSVTRIT